MSRWDPNDFERRFWAAVDKTNECWNWTKSTSKGYGKIYRNGTRVLAHRASYEMHFGPIPDGLFVCHSCDNKRCVSPEHLFVGDQVTNMQDWTAKGRNKLVSDPEYKAKWSGDNHWLRGPRGENGRKKIAKARRAEFASGKRSVVRGSDGKIRGTTCQAT